MLALYICLFCAAATTTTRAITLLDSAQSFAVYQRWNITTAGRLSLRFKTHSAYCLLLYVDGDTTGDTGSFIEVSIVRRELVVHRKVAGDSDAKVIRLGTDLNDLEWHHLRITKYLDMLEVQLDRETKRIAFDDTEHMFRVQSHVYLGGLPSGRNSFGAAVVKPKFVGCIEDLKLSPEGSFDLQLVDKVLESKSMSPTCIDNCGVHSCQNEGKCVNLFSTTRCDCFGTGHDGPQCTKPTETIHQERDDFIEWTLPDPSFNTLYLKVRFKAAKESGVLFFTNRRGTQFIVEVVSGRVRVAGGWKTMTEPPSITIPHNVLDAEWHSLDIRKKGKYVTARLDKHGLWNLTLVPANTNDDKVHEEQPVYFGGVPSPRYMSGIKSQTNFIGCLQQIHYNDKDVLYKLVKTINKKIEQRGSLKKGCPYSKSNIMIPTTTSTTTKATKRPRPTYTDESEGGEKVIERRHTIETGLSQGVIVWITAAIVIGTIIILISAGCVVHHIRMKYSRQSRSNRRPSHTSSIDEKEEEELKIIVRAAKQEQNAKKQQQHDPFIKTSNESIR